MMHLVTVAARARLTIKLIFISIGVGIFIWLAKGPTLSLIALIFPDRDPPTLAYGQLDALKFIEIPIAGTPKYNLNTKNGRLPSDLPKKMVVYPVKKPSFSYSAAKRAQDDASAIGYSETELVTDLTGDIYRWRDTSTGSQLEIDIGTRSLSINTPIAPNASNFDAGITTSLGKKLADTFFSKTGRLDDVLYGRGTTTVTRGKVLNDKFVTADTIASSVIARVDYFRTIVRDEEYPILGPNAKEGLVYVYVRIPSADGLTALNYPIVSYNQWELEPNVSGTYPLITVSEAWDEVKNGRGVISNVTPLEKSIIDEYQTTRVDEILVNEVYIGYYDTPERQNYLQPIYVFEGSYNVRNKPGGDITIYFPAIQAKYIK